MDGVPLLLVCFFLIANELVDGYGIAYMVDNQFLQFNIAGLKPMETDKMAFILEESIHEMRELLEVSAPPPKAKL
jgi:hypothetical protein